MDLTNISTHFTFHTLDEIIKNSGGCKHISYEFTDGIDKKGDSYLSDLYRLKVTGTKENGETMIVNVVVKAMPKSATRRKIFRSSDFFRNEIKFYTVVIPAFEKFQNKRCPKNPFNSYPKCLATHCDGENDFVVLENISFEGYQTPVRQDYTDIETCTLIMRALGRFHALSLAYKDQENIDDLIPAVEEVYYKEELRNWYNPFLELATLVAIDSISKTYSGTKYEKKSKQFLTENLYDEMIKLVSTRTKYSVIGHGDCWRPNFLTKYNENNNAAESVKIIDFQLVRYGSPVLDIIFFLYNSTSEKQREEYYENLIKEYHESAAALIRELGSNPELIFPYSGLQNELKEFARFGCGFCIESLPLSMMEDDEITDLNSINCDNATLLDFWKIKYIQNEEHRQRLASIFKHSIDSGYMELK